MVSSFLNPSRRDFLKQAGVAAGCMAAPGLWAAQTDAPTQPLWLVSDPSDPVASAGPAKWSIDQFRAALHARNVQLSAAGAIADTPPGSFCVIVAGPGSVSRNAMPNPSPEAMKIVPARLAERDALLVIGADVSGLVYALTHLADAVALDESPLSALHPAKPIDESPANRIRSVMRLFVSDVEDKPWFNDRDFWRAYLSMLAAQRFNRFNLALGIGYDFARELLDTYFYFAYPFLVKVPGYDVRATNLPDKERDQNLEMLRFISDETAARGMRFQLGLWTHAYRWPDSPKVNYNIDGLNSSTHAPYCRDALTTVLKECPNISGVTFRIHGESGVAEGSYDFWKTVFDGAVNCGREVGIDMHAKGMTHRMIDVALGTGLPVQISPKFWAEHMGLPYHQAAIRPTEVPRRQRGEGLFAASSGSRSFLRYGYGDLLAEDRKYGIVHRVWPGTQRLLLWGDPLFASAYGKAMSFCGSLGCELMEPLSFKGRKGSGLPGGRDAYADASLKPKRDFEKYLYTYRLWGRMLYNPDCDPDTWRRQLQHDFGEAAEPIETSLSHASRILPLVTTAHLPSAANNNYWPEMYVNMSIVDDSHPQPYTDTPSPKRFGAVSPLDPQLFSTIIEYVHQLLAGHEHGPKYSPIEVADWLSNSVGRVPELPMDLRGKLPDPNSAAFRRASIDIAILAGLGRFFSEKLTAGVLYELFIQTADRKALDLATQRYQQARNAWAELSRQSQAAYVADVTFGPEWFQRGRWDDRLAEIDRDIQRMKQAASTTQPAPAEKVAAAIQHVIKPAARPALNIAHTPPEKFQRAQPISLQFSSTDDQPHAARLHYRRVNQADAWRVDDMQQNDRSYRAAIPGEYTDSVFAIQYYFELRNESGDSALYPGLNATLTNCPYFVVRMS